MCDSKGIVENLCLQVGNRLMSLGESRAFDLVYNLAKHQQTHRQFAYPRGKRDEVVV